MSQKHYRQRRGFALSVAIELLLPGAATNKETKMKLHHKSYLIPGQPKTNAQERFEDEITSVSHTCAKPFVSRRCLQTSIQIFLEIVRNIIHKRACQARRCTNVEERKELSSKVNLQ